MQVSFPMSHAVAHAVGSERETKTDTEKGFIPRDWNGELTPERVSGLKICGRVGRSQRSDHQEVCGMDHERGWTRSSAI